MYGQNCGSDCHSDTFIEGDALDEACFNHDRWERWDELGLVQPPSQPPSHPASPPTSLPHCERPRRCLESSANDQFVSKACPLTDVICRCDADLAAAAWEVCNKRQIPACSCLAVPSCLPVQLLCSVCRCNATPSAGVRQPPLLAPPALPCSALPCPALPCRCMQQRPRSVHGTTSSVGSQRLQCRPGT